MQIKKQQLDPNMNQWIGSKLEKEYIKTVYCHPPYLTYMQKAFMFALSLEQCLTLCDPMDCSMPGSSIHGISQARIVEQLAIIHHVKARLDESHVGIKIAIKIINSLRYADITLMAEIEEELKSLLMKVKEESEKAGLKLNIQ